MTDLGFDRPLYILPFDHRGSFQSGLFGWKGTLTSEQTNRVAASKAIIYEGMSVDPGFGGRAFIAGTIDKVSRLRAELVRRRLEHVEIEVDGGVGPENIRALADAGMTIAVAGTSVFDPRAPVAADVGVLRAACGLRESARHPGAHAVTPGCSNRSPPC
jgi:hypothetical protein